MHPRQHAFPCICFAFIQSIWISSTILLTTKVQFLRWNCISFQQPTQGLQLIIPAFYNLLRFKFWISVQQFLSNSQGFFLHCSILQFSTRTYHLYSIQNSQLGDSMFKLLLVLITSSIILTPFIPIVLPGNLLFQLYSIISMYPYP